MKHIIGCLAVYLLASHAAFSQVDTTFIYRTNTAFGTLDLRIAKSPTRYYYLQENVTFSFRESSPGIKTGTYRDMTSWDSSPYTQGNLREKSGNADYFVLNYRVLFPQNYSAAYPEGYPLIVMMHGAGERGNCWDTNCFWDTKSWRPNTNNPTAPNDINHELLNNDYNLLHGGSVHLEARNLAGGRLPNDPNMPDRAFPGFVVFPQNLNGWDGNSAQDAIRLLRLLSKKYNIDPNRIYVHGLSNGGNATYDLIKRAPWMFAAASPMSAPSESSIISKGLLPKVSHIPLWIFQGGLDGAPTPSRTHSYVNKFRDAGMAVRYTEYSNLGHGVWNTAYAEPDFFSWILGNNKANIHVFAGVSAICESTGQGVRMELAEGFFQYEWQLDGETISGATSATYVANTPGTYRARFSRKQNPTPSDWNRWSDPVHVTTQNLGKPRITQTGSVVLKGMDNYGYAHLKAEGDFAHYYWYKDGVLLNLPGSQDDTTRYVRLSAGSCSSGICTGNGVYTLKVAGAANCLSVASDGKYIFFNNQAPTNISAPTNFTGTALADARVSLSWSDESTNENGFEIWRRRQTGTTYSKWEMAPLINANTTSMIDNGLMPSATYQFKIRAVGNTGRSNYTPSASNQYLTVVTTSDTQSPTVPQNLTARVTDLREIELEWSPSSDNLQLKEYLIYYGSEIIATGSPVTSYKLADLPLNKQYVFKVRSKDIADNLSGESNEAFASTVVNGLFYKHTTGAFTDIDLIDWSFAEYKGVVSNFTLAPRTQEDYFNFQFEGYLYIEQAGTYQFQSYSDDGSRVTIDNILAVDNDGQHSPRTITGSNLSLNTGPRLINVKYFEYTGGQTLTVSYKGPDTENKWVAIPDAALRSISSGSAGMMAYESAGPADDVKEESIKTEIFPNPARPDENITLHLTGVHDPVRIRLTDMRGLTYFEKTLTTEEYTPGFKIIPSKALTGGMYILQILEGTRTRTKIVMVRN